MKDFKEYLNEEDSSSANLNYIMASIYKMAVSDSDNLKPLVLMLAATVMATLDDAKATQMSRKLAQLAVTLNKN